MIRRHIVLRISFMFVSAGGVTMCEFKFSLGRTIIIMRIALALAYMMN